MNTTTTAVGEFSKDEVGDTVESCADEQSVNEERQSETESAKLGEDDPVTMSDALKKYVGPSMNWVDMMAEEDRQEKLNDEKNREEKQKALMSAVESLKEPFIVYVSNMAQQTLGEDIFYFFGGADAVVEYYFYTSEGNHAPSGDGLVELADKESLVKALLSNSRELFRKKLCVEYVEPVTNRCITADELPAFVKKAALSANRRTHAPVLRERREQNQGPQRRGQTDSYYQSHGVKRNTAPQHQPISTPLTPTTENITAPPVNDMVTIRQPINHVRNPNIFGNTEPGRDLMLEYMKKKESEQRPPQTSETESRPPQGAKEPWPEAEQKPPPGPLGTTGRSGSTASASNNDGVPASKRVYANSARGHFRTSRPVPDISKLTKHLPAAPMAVRSDATNAMPTNNRGNRMSKPAPRREHIRSKLSVDSNHSSVTTSSAAPTIEDTAAPQGVTALSEQAPGAHSESEAPVASATESSTGQASTSRTKKPKANKKKKNVKAPGTGRFAGLNEVTS